jgi:hypothetical protein
MLLGQLELLPAPWKSGERLTLTMMLAGGQKIGIIGCAVSAAERDGKAIWEINVRRHITGGMNSGVSQVVVEQKTNRPITTEWDHYSAEANHCQMVGRQSCHHQDNEGRERRKRRQSTLILRITRTINGCSGSGSCR